MIIMIIMMMIIKQLWHIHEVDMMFYGAKKTSYRPNGCVIIVLLHQLINTN